MDASPLLIQPYPLSLSPAGRICEKSNTSLRAGYLCDISLPIDLDQASAESPIVIVHTPSLKVSVLCWSPSLSVRVLRITSSSRMGSWKPVSCPTIGLNPTPQPCMSNQRTSTTSYTVSTCVNAQLN